jgi:phosphate transport system protein
MAVIKKITDLERIEDEAEKVTKMAIEISARRGLQSCYIGIIAMGNLVRKMVHDALDTFARMDSRAALETTSREPEFDKMYMAILRQLVTCRMEDSCNITGTIDGVWRHWSALVITCATSANT